MHTFIQLLTNARGRIRREFLRGREYLVAPMTLIVPGVLNGSRGALYYPPEEISANIKQWDGVPITVDHPTHNGTPVSAHSPGVLARVGIGLLHKTAYRGKLVSEGWFDVAKTKKVRPDIIRNLEAGVAIELSTGLFTDNEPYAGTYNGMKYDYIARNYRPDHLAILPDAVGACSLNDGCGVLVNEVKPIRPTFNEAKEEGGRWVTISGTPVFISKDGQIEKGPKALKEASTKKDSKSSKSGESTTEFNPAHEAAKQARENKERVGKSQGKPAKSDAEKARSHDTLRSELGLKPKGDTSKTAPPAKPKPETTKEQSQEEIKATASKVNDIREKASQHADANDPLQDIRDQFKDVRTRLDSLTREVNGDQLPQRSQGFGEGERVKGIMSKFIDKVSAKPEDGKTVLDRFRGAADKLTKSIDSFKGSGLLSKVGRFARYGAAKLGQKIGQTKRTLLGNEGQPMYPIRPMLSINAYCPTGKGGGQDNSCSSKGGGKSTDRQEAYEGPMEPGGDDAKVSALLKQYGMEETGGGDDFSAYSIKGQKESSQIYLKDDQSWEHHDYAKQENDNPESAQKTGTSLRSLKTYLGKLGKKK